MITTMQPTTATRPVATGAVISRDGTKIGYRAVGDGPAVLLLHGAMETSHSHLDLAQLLADRARVILPDRRGRGASGPAAPDDGIARQVEDVAALMAQTGARALIGVSAGALIALEAARVLPDIDRVVLFEPPLSIDGSISPDWVRRVDAEIAAGKTSAALVTGMLAAEMGPPWMLKLPRPVLEAMTGAMLWLGDRRPPADGAMSWRELAPTLHVDGRILADMDGPADRFRDLRTDVLLVGGSATRPYLRRALDLLEATLPRARRVVLPGLDHGAASNRDERGHPEQVAVHVRPFLGLD